MGTYIKDVVFVAGKAAYYFDDQAAIKRGASQNGFIYSGQTHTVGFDSVRQPGESISILLILSSDQVAKGDCVAVQYSGAGGRDLLFTSNYFIPFLEEHIKPLLLKRKVNSFLQNAQFFDQLKIDGQLLHTAIRYGLSQALLDAAAIANKKTRTEVICAEYNLPIKPERIGIFGQSGDDRYLAVDKMILKEVESLPHALINNVENKLGQEGEILRDYLIWLKERVFSVRNSEDYLPDIHIDVYGTLGMIFNNNIVAIAEYIDQLQGLLLPLKLYIEGPIDMGEKEKQIQELKKIKDHLAILGSSAKIVADEWCNTYQDIVAFVDARCCHMVQIKTPDLGSLHNTIEAVLYAKENDIEAYQGGTCNETEVSAQACVQVALACRPQRLLAKPGMGFDEGMTIVNNELQRTIALLQRAAKAMSQQSLEMTG